MRFSILLSLLLALVSSVNCQLLYFSNDRIILSYDISKGIIDTIWQSPFSINDVAINQSGQIITFTKPLSKNRPDRSVGYYLVSEKRYEIIPTKSDNCFGSIASQSGQSIVFNANLTNKWQVSLLDRKSNIVSYGIFQYGDDVVSPYGWASDSVLEVMTFAGVIHQNIFTQKHSMTSVPKELAGTYGLPGTKWLTYNDSLSYINTGDFDINIESLEGPAVNLFEIKNGKCRKLLKGKIYVDDFFLCDYQIFIQYTDYSSRKGKSRLGVYNIKSGVLKTIDVKLKVGKFQLVGSGKY